MGVDGGDVDKGEFDEVVGKRLLPAVALKREIHVMPSPFFIFQPFGRYKHLKTLTKDLEHANCNVVAHL